MIIQSLSSVRNTINQILHSPFGLQLSILSLFVLFLTSFQPTYFFWNKTPFGDSLFFQQERIFTITETGFIDNFAQVQNTGIQEITTDEDGNLVAQRKPRNTTKALDYTVKSGDTLLKISHKFGLNVSTLLWSNNLTIKETITPGQILTIPPADGVYYTVELGDTLSEIAQLHDIRVQDIYQYNDLNNEGTIHRGKELFLPDAKKIYIEHTPFQSPIRSVASAPPTLSSTGLKLKKPTTGIITQGVHAGHTAIDIANSMNTPIYSAQAGKVVTAAGGWNYGYGNHVIIDHGNNIQTLYAHLNSYNVKVGQQIKTGELIGKMGNSGNVIGPTGIHLHFEVRINGRKMNPNNYF